ncbi:ABC transporter permease [Cardinium endosymbiont of Oedothorax gibbosus]|uniref:ABC transporter permease n=1 Tax=Cardinium endosymbiont of Oedothorax gibbosus TaxID=931101 RepID=UPI002111D0B8|nr:ABC transporter permease [Cardinium endosymbiont of Oedothorax gibbosus]CAH2559863.1 MacB-like periplasmic core / ABC3 transporter permease protein domain-containing protein [Cardinium endosymbiont of Oedothorax gibbosus]
MFGYQWFLEVFCSLKAHRIRTVFTGFGVMWAMLILLLLQGAGAGFYNGMVKRFQSYSNRFMSIHAGYRSTGTVHLTETLTEDLARNLNAFEQIMPVFRTDRSVAYAQVVHKSSILGVRVGYRKIKHLELVEGRFFTERDVAQKLPVCILGLKTKTALFDKQSAVGQPITVDGTVVGVIGVLEATDGMDDDTIIISSSLFKALFPQNVERVDTIMATLTPNQNPIQVAKKARAYLARCLNFERQDTQALQINSSSKRARPFQILFRVMQGFIWLVSLCFLVSGVVGVGNMMLVVVKERRQELAIRKVVGATSGHIMGLILLESIVINLISGILGLGIGISMLQWMNSYLLPIIEKHGIARFEFQFPMVVYALVFLVLSGCLAGIIPAKRALCIKPVDALNNE